MRGGRLKIVNESRFADEEVEALVRFGLSEIDLTGERIVAVVKNTAVTKRRGGPVPYSGLAYSLSGGIPSSMYDRYCGKRSYTRHLIVMRIGPSEVFPVTAFRRYAGVEKDEFRDWREALVGITAHEGMHAQHEYDGAYRSKSGSRKPVTFRGRVVARGAKVRVGVERIEPKCEAFEAYMLRRFRESIDSCPPGSSLLPSVGQTAMAREAAA